MPFLTSLELEQVEQDPDFVALSRKFKATATELISVLEQVKLNIYFCIHSKYGIDLILDST